MDLEASIATTITEDILIAVQTEEEVKVAMEIEREIVAEVVHAEERVEVSRAEEILHGTSEDGVVACDKSESNVLLEAKNIETSSEIEAVALPNEASSEVASTVIVEAVIAHEEKLTESVAIVQVEVQREEVESAVNVQEVIVLEEAAIVLEEKEAEIVASVVQVAAQSEGESTVNVEAAITLEEKEVESIPTVHVEAQGEEEQVVIVEVATALEEEAESESEESASNIEAADIVLEEKEDDAQAVKEINAIEVAINDQESEAEEENGERSKQLEKTKQIQKRQKKSLLQKKQKKLEISRDDCKTSLRVSKFIKFHPAGIECMASYSNQNLLAVGRVDSSIEIWRVGSWSQQLRIQSSTAEKALHLLFVDLPESKTVVLLAFCANGLVKLYDLRSQDAKHEYTNAGGYIWGVSLNKHTGEILTACEDGFVRILTVDEEYGLKIRFVSSIRNFDERALNVCWDASNSEEFYCSYESGLIRKFNKSRQVVITMDVKENGQKTVGWKIESLADSYMCVGCSDGQVRIFETRFGTVVKSFKKHEADVTEIASSPSSGCFYVTGADSRIVAFKIVRGEWIVFSEDRGQSHDIKSLIILEASSTLLSGGITTDICAYTLQADGKFTESERVASHSSQKAKKRVRHILGIDQLMETRISLSSESSLALLRRAFSLELWEFDGGNLNYQHLLEIKVNSFVRASALSASGEVLAYATETEINVFEVTKGTRSVNLKKIVTLPIVATLLKFSEGSLASGSSSASSQPEFLVVVEASGKVSTLSIDGEAELQSLASLEGYGTATHITIGPKNKSVFIGSKFTNEIVEIGLSSKTRGKVLFEVPKLCENAHFTHVKVLASTKQLVVTYENRKFALFDLITKTLSKWTKDNFERLPQSYLSRNNQIMGVLKHPSIPKRIILYTTDSFVIVDLAVRAPKIALFQRPNQSDREEISESFTIKEFSKPIIFAAESLVREEHLSKNAITLFQIDFADMLATLPGAILSKKFGN